MPNLGSHISNDAAARYERKTAQKMQQKQSALEGALSSVTTKQDARREGLGKVAEVLVAANDWLYRHFAKGQDMRHLRSLSEEIDARFRGGALGVLLHRITKRNADGAGNFLPEYVGLIVVGEGATEASAIYDFEQRRSAALARGQETEGPGVSVCTAMNPTGRPEKAQAVLRGAPEGFNLGYAASISAKIMKTMQSNHRNIGPVMFGSAASPLQPKSYLEYEYVYVPLEIWEKLKTERVL